MQTSCTQLRHLTMLCTITLLSGAFPKSKPGLACLYTQALHCAVQLSSYKICDNNPYLHQASAPSCCNVDFAVANCQRHLVDTVNRRAQPLHIECKQAIMVHAEGSHVVLSISNKVFYETFRAQYILLYST